jgi:hypothetical protein
MFSDWVSFLAYPNLFGIKGFVVVVVVIPSQTVAWYNIEMTKLHFLLTVFKKTIATSSQDLPVICALRA